MIFTSLVSVISSIVIMIFSLVPDVYTLPSIFGFDIDSAFISAMGTANRFFEVVWALQYLFQGFLVIAGYFAIKIIVRLIIGSRTPTN